MEKQEKSEIQKAVDLLEENGFHVARAEEEYTSPISMKHSRGTILLQIVPKKEAADKN
jgi:hypothetical protein